MKKIVVDPYELSRAIGLSESQIKDMKAKAEKLADDFKRTGDFELCLEKINSYKLLKTDCL